MAFDNTDFEILGSKGKVKLSTYLSADNIATTIGSGYFNNINKLIATGDLCFAVCSDGFRLLQFTVSAAGVVTVAVADLGATAPLQF